MMACSVAAVAQRYTNEADVFAGFQYLRFDTFDVQNSNLTGWNGQLSDYIWPHFGVKGEVTGTYGSPAVGGQPTKLHTYTYMGGPVFRLPGQKFSPFLHALFGAAHMSDASGIYDSTGFSYALGGGVDCALKKNLQLRFQPDYFQTRLDDPTGTGNNAQHHLRFSTGIVLKF